MLPRVSAARLPLWSDIGVATTHQVHEFLRCRFVGATAVAALLRHRTANALPDYLRAGSFTALTAGAFIDRFGDRLVEIARRIATVDVANAHTAILCCDSALTHSCTYKLHELQILVATVWCRLNFTPLPAGSLHQRKVKEVVRPVETASRCGREASGLLRPTSRTAPRCVQLLRSDSVLLN